MLSLLLVLLLSVQPPISMQNKSEKTIKFVFWQEIRYTGEGITGVADL